MISKIERFLLEGRALLHGDADIDAEYERLRDQHGLSFTGEPHVVHRDARSASFG